MDEPRLREARADAEAALLAGIEAADPEALVREALGDGELGDLAPERTRLAAVGKAAPGMARALAEAVPGARGVCAAPASVLEAEGVGSPPAGWEVVAGGHPLPTEGSVAAGEALLEQARSVPADGALLVAVSGGGSACAEVADVPLADLRWVTEGLLAAGVGIGDLNAVRRRLSRLKGGGLARACPGAVHGLILSDVVGDTLADVASGPTVPASPEPGRAGAVLEEVGLWDEAPPSVREAVEEAGEAPGSGGGPVENELVGGNGVAVAATAEALKARGYEVRVRQAPVTGEAREEGAELARRGLEAAGSDGGGVAVVAGGEATVTVTGDGDGGPCQELVVAAAEVVDGEPVVVGAAATDGVDGPTDAAGGVVDGTTAEAAREAGRDPERALERNDAYRFLEAVGGLVRTGVTGTNVNDVVVALAPPS